MDNQIQPHLMPIFRERLGLEPTDTSKDDEIKARQPIDNLRELSAWEFGDPSWADIFVRWSQGVGIKFVKDPLSIY